MSAVQREVSADTAPEPVTILQFWDHDIPASVAELVDSVRTTNPNANYRLFDDPTAMAFVRDEFGAEAAALYDVCAIPAMRADLFRYCFLARCGGFYVDADLRALRPIDPLVTPDRRGLLYRREKGFTNSIMYFRDAEDPLAIRIVELALERISERSSSSVWEATGPGVMRTLENDPATAPLFEGMALMGEADRRDYFAAPHSLEYKSQDHHWLVAREKGISIFRD